MVLKQGVRTSLFVTLDPNILHQAINNLEVISEPDQLTNAFAECHVGKR